jgi:hypothetical protein
MGRSNMERERSRLTTHMVAAKVLPAVCEVKIHMHIWSPVFYRMAVPRLF